MSIDYLIVGIVVGWFALMTALVPRGAARARREQNRRRLELLTGDDAQPTSMRAQPTSMRARRAGPNDRPGLARENMR